MKDLRDLKDLTMQRRFTRRRFVLKVFRGTISTFLRRELFSVGVFFLQICGVGLENQHYANSDL